jgi:RimJ/RimL family protein N-acetyltransferase
MIDYILQEENLLLRPLKSEDLENIWPHVSDPEISEFMSWAPHTDKNETKEFLKRIENNFDNRTGITWAIIFNNEFCGIFSIIAITRTHRALVYNRAELAYWCGKKFQGQGIMSRAAKLVLRFAFNVLKLNRLVVSHFTINNASEKLIKKMGFSYIGTEHEAFQKYGVWYDHALYELLSREYLKQRHYDKF